MKSPLILSFIIVAVGLLAGLIPFFFKWTHATAHRWIAFGAGTILGAAFVHMIPEGMELAGPSSLPVILLGFLALYGLEQISLVHPHDEETGQFHEVGYLTFIGLTVHDLVDGIALGSLKEVPELTPAIFLALILHKIPSTFSLSLVMLHGGYTRKTIVKYLVVLLAVIPLGVLISQSLVQLLGANHDRTVGWLIQFSAGTFIYIGAYELLPEMHRKSGPNSKIGWFFGSGILAMFVLKLLHPVF